MSGGGGFGSGPWGGSPWGGSGGLVPPVDTLETVTISEGLNTAVIPAVLAMESVAVADNVGIFLPLLLLSALPLSGTVLRLTFSHDLDITYGPTVDISNYSITPSVTVLGASIGPLSNMVTLTTTPQGAATYNLTAFTARSTGTDLLFPAPTTISFAGLPLIPTFYATGQSRRKVSPSPLPCSRMRRSQMQPIMPSQI